jgi:transducin (beta)-like 1
MPHLGLFKNVEISLTSEMDVRSASFHPIDPVLACALFSGGILLVKSSWKHSTSLSTWKLQCQFRCEYSALSLNFNVSNSTCADAFLLTLTVCLYFGCAEDRD